MVRSILLGLLAAGILPITLADAVATSDRSIPQLSTKLDLTACTLKERSPYCQTQTSTESLEIDSQLWLKNLANVFLSGSMFGECKLEFEPEYSLNKNTPASLCIFPWQQPSTLADRDRLLSITPPSSDDSSPDLEPTIAVEENIPKFPTISRSSLIVSLPTADSTFVPKDTKLANPAPKTQRIASPFGWRTRPYTYQPQFHQGIDYGAPLGSPVVAVGNGIVTKVVSGCYDFDNLFCGGQLGNWIEIDHGDGRMGVYGHLKNNSIAVEEGMKVKKNQEIAQVGSSGWSTGAHLDFRFKINGEYQDPARYLTPPTISRVLDSD